MGCPHLCGNRRLLDAPQLSRARCVDTHFPCDIPAIMGAHRPQIVVCHARRVHRSHRILGAPDLLAHALFGPNTLARTRECHGRLDDVCCCGNIAHH